MSNALRLPVALAILLLAGLEARAGVPEHRAADVGAPEVTAANLLESERFWPTRVRLTRPWQVAGREAPLREGARGALIRVEPGPIARIDMGRGGLHEVPVDATDLIERANRVRTGELDKDLPNFVWGVGPRLLDASRPGVRAMDLEDVYRFDAYLCAFGDPDAAALPDLVASIAPLSERAGLLSIFFPQGFHADLKIHGRLRELGWPVAFVLDQMAEPYTRILLEPAPRPPALALFTREGRLLFAAEWRPERVHDLLVALDGFLGGEGDVRIGAQEP